MYSQHIIFLQSLAYAIGVSFVLIFPTDIVFSLSLSFLQKVVHFACNFKLFLLTILQNHNENDTFVLKQSLVAFGIFLIMS